MCGWRRLCVPVLALLALTGGCHRADEPLPRPDLSKRPANVVATTGMIADIVKEVGGEHVRVEALMGPGVDPHRYIPTAGDLTRLQSADVIFYNGLHLEGKMADVFEDMAHRVRTVAVTSRLDPAKELRAAEEGYEGAHDPHVWFDVRLWMKAVECVRDTLIDLDPAHADAFRANADRYLKQLAELDEEVRTKAAKIPSERRVLITAHDAFHYFGRAYGFEVRGLQGVSTASDISSRDVQDLASFIGTHKIPAIFGETSVPDRNIMAVQAAVRKGWDFDVRLVEDKLFSDALGEPGTPAGTYIGMVRHNIDVMVKALDGR